MVRNINNIRSDEVIWAMGAEHMKPDRLERVINLMQLEYKTYGEEPYEPNEMNIDTVMSYGVPAPSFMYDWMSFIAEEKYDGWDYIAHRGEFISSEPSKAKGHEGEPIVKTGNIDENILEITRAAYEHLGVDLQGEINFYGGNSDTVTSIMGCTPDKAQTRLEMRRAEGMPNMRYTLLDIRRFMGNPCVHEPWYIRRALLEYVYQWIEDHFGRQKAMMFTPIAEVVGEPTSAFKRIVQAGGEGLVIKNTKAIFVPGGKPANTWIKVKRAVTLDVFITDLDLNGTGKNTGLFRSLEVGIMENGRTKIIGNVNSGIDDGMRRIIKDTWPEYRNKVIEIDAMDINEKTKSLRSARLMRVREDKHWMDCHGEYTVKGDII